MFDLWRDKGSTAEEKRQELLSAYLDNALAPVEREQFETKLAGDPRLQAELQQLRALKLTMQRMPRRRVPRSFALDPAVYGRPKSQPLLQLYPVLRGATALTAFLLIFTLALGVFRGGFAPAGPVAAPASEVALSNESMAESAPAAEAAIPFEAAATSAPDLRDSAPAEPELSAPAAVTGQETAEGEQGADSPALEGATEGVDTVAVTVAPAGEMGTMATEAVGVAEEVSPAATEVPPVIPTEESSPAGMSLLRSVQIALAIAFILLLALFFLARRQVNRL
jgi:anti-sigma factor RsiW